MADTYLNHYRHLNFPIHRHTHKANWAAAHKGAESAGVMGKKLAESRVEARFLARS